MGGGCSRSTDAADKKKQLIQLVDSMLASYRRVVAASMDQAGLGNEFVDAVCGLLGSTLNEICEVVPQYLDTELLQLQALETQLFDTKLDAADPDLLELPRVLLLCLHVMGEAHCRTWLRPVIVPALCEVSAVLHRSGFMDSVSCAMFERISNCHCTISSLSAHSLFTIGSLLFTIGKSALQFVLHNGLVPLLVAAADVESAAATGDPGAVRAEIDRFGLLLLGDEEELREIRRQSLKEWLEPVITVCKAEFDVFPRYITMLCHTAEVTHYTVKQQWLSSGADR